MARKRKVKVADKAWFTLEEIYSCCIKTSEGCFEWQNAVARNGYGVATRNNRRWTITRVVMNLVYGFEMENSEILVLHKCDNPKCVNPEHLFIGTTKDNIRDKIKKGRHLTEEGLYCNTKLKVAEVKEIFRLSKAGLSNRKIAKCFNVSRGTIDNIINRVTYKSVA